MAARLRAHHQEDIRLKIKGVQLLRLVQEYSLTGRFNGEEIEPKRVDAAAVLLRKVIPDLAAVEINDRREGWADALQRLARQEKVIDAEPVAQLTHDAPQQTSELGVVEEQPIIVNGQSACTS